MDTKQILDQHPGTITRLQANLEQAQKDGDEGRAVAYALELAGKRVDLAEARAAKAEADKEVAEKLFSMKLDIADLTRRAKALNRRPDVGKLPGAVSEMSEYEVGVEVDRRVKKHLKQHPKATYSDGYKAVLAADSELHDAYTGGWALEIFAQNNPDPIEPTMPMAEAGVELTKRINAHMVDHDKADYQTAKSFVLDADPELKASYSQMVN